MRDGIFFFHSPGRKFAKEITRRACYVFGFRDSAIDQRASGTRPDLSHNERAVFANNSPQMLDGRSCSRSSDRFWGVARSQFAIAPRHFAHAQCEERVRRAV